MTERFAIYYAPAAQSQLWQQAETWLSNDGAGPLPLEQTASARRYGFHATLKAPMALAAAESQASLVAAMEDFAASAEPVSIGRLTPQLIGGGFLALIPEQQTTALTDFVGTVVAAFEPFRAPLNDGDRERRIRSGALSPRQIELLEQFGYPYVMEEFQFHMTLSDRLPETEGLAARETAERTFAEAIAEPFLLDRLVLFHEAEPGAPFTRGPDFLLGRQK